ALELVPRQAHGVGVSPPGERIVRCELLGQECQDADHDQTNEKNPYESEEPVYLGDLTGRLPLDRRCQPTTPCKVTNSPIMTAINQATVAVHQRGATTNDWLAEPLMLREAQ
ncbi:MAG TPA: hypothetical protein DF783_01255, partial [Acidimicrobiaceae bacterium]|nr:hypothetical protein [Acidimicrobiaceae bacterium]